MHGYQGHCAAPEKEDGGEGTDSGEEEEKDAGGQAEDGGGQEAEKEGLGEANHGYQ